MCLPCVKLKMRSNRFGAFYIPCLFVFFSANCGDFFCVTRIFNFLYHQWADNPAPQRADRGWCTGQVCDWESSESQCLLLEGQEATLRFRVIFRTYAQVDPMISVYLEKGAFTKLLKLHHDNILELSKAPHNSSATLD